MDKERVGIQSVEVGFALQQHETHSHGSARVEKDSGHAGPGVLTLGPVATLLRAKAHAVSRARGCAMPQASCTA